MTPIPPLMRTFFTECDISGMISFPTQHFDASLFRREGPAGDELVQLLVGVVDDELLEAVALRYLEAVQVEHANHVVLPRSLHLKQSKAFEVK